MDRQLVEQVRELLAGVERAATALEELVPDEDMRARLRVGTLSSAARDAQAALEDKSARDPGGVTMRCSFCSKGQAEVDKLVAGPEVFICNECIDLCATVLDEHRAEAAARASSVDATEAGADDDDDEHGPTSSVRLSNIPPKE